MELTLRVLEDAGFSKAEGGRVFPIMLHYTVGFVIEGQSRTGIEYADATHTSPTAGASRRSPVRYPRTAQLVSGRFADDADEEFDYRLRVILAGILATRTVPERP
ncbi:TetR/AcrR family transcriptional regulator C-terminal domain-containing protein [Nocardia sp. NPDC051463]|uniref:TetR/AcrR family transcriptional regulator C-terminal domain-containing protein n=1 Tax=Nocardia sp. NPDC051463 TaxID=3154845 RepID=UPI003450DC5E